MNKPLEYIVIPVAAREKLVEHSPDDIGQAVLMAIYCGRMLNGGRIEGAAKWTDKQCMAKLGLEFLCRFDAPGLWHWEGDDLIVELYSVEYERKALAKRDSAKRAIAKRWNKARYTDVYTDVYTDEYTKRISERNTSCNTSKDKESIITPFSRNNTSLNDNDKTTHNDHARALPRSVEEVRGYMAALPMCALEAEELMKCAERFFNDKEENGWRTRHGLPIVDWRAAARTYMQYWRSYRDNGASGSNNNYDLKLTR